MTNIKLLTMARAAISNHQVDWVGNSPSCWGFSGILRLYHPQVRSQKISKFWWHAKLGGGFSLSLRPIKSLKFHGGQRNVAWWAIAIDG
ncbi:hypothetical protein SPLC1_S380030 [Arthrospira platensis C1]|nr:hypothetical protein SPLC1_S380030 [Arthrospira platensis C1]